MQTSDVTRLDTPQPNNHFAISDAMAGDLSMDNLTGLRRAKIWQLTSLHLYKENMMILTNYILCLTGITFQNHLKIVSGYNQEIPQSQTADTSMAPRGRATQESKLSKATRSLFPIKMIAKIEWT